MLMVCVYVWWRCVQWLVCLDKPSVWSYYSTAVLTASPSTHVLPRSLLARDGGGCCVLLLLMTRTCMCGCVCARRDSDHCSALHAAVTNNNTDCAALVIAAAGDAFVNLLDQTGGTALHVAARYAAIASALAFRSFVRSPIVLVVVCACGQRGACGVRAVAVGTRGRCDRLRSPAVHTAQVRCGVRPSRLCAGASAAYTLAGRRQ